MIQECGLRGVKRCKCPRRVQLYHLCTSFQLLMCQVPLQSKEQCEGKMSQAVASLPESRCPSELCFVVLPLELFLAIPCLGCWPGLSRRRRSTSALPSKRRMPAKCICIRWTPRTRIGQGPGFIANLLQSRFLFPPPELCWTMATLLQCGELPRMATSGGSSAIVSRRCA